MPFTSALYDGSDPMYSPGLNWSDGKYPNWRPPKRYVDAGYAVRGERLEGIRGDGLDAKRAQRCRELTREMLRWWEGLDHSGPEAGTFGHLIQKYLTDEFSPFRSVKPITQQDYIEFLNRWIPVIGEMRVGDLGYEGIMQIKMAMEAKGRSTSYIKRMFTMLRIATRYGRMTRFPGARDVTDILTDLRIANPPKRTVAPTREQVYAIVEEADRRKQTALAVGTILCFELCLRAVDVRGQWYKSDDETGVWYNGRQWKDGLTWDMFSSDLTSFSKVISKTSKSLPEPYIFDLTPLPHLIEQLKVLHAAGSGVGPVIVSSNGRPYTRNSWSQAFRRVREALDLPEDIASMELRAGGLTEAKQIGLDPLMIRDAGQHRQLSTTDGYMRGRSESANKVVQLRQKK